MTDLAPVFGTPPEVRGGASVAAGVLERVRFGLGVGENSSFGGGEEIPLGRTARLFGSTVCPNTGKAIANVHRHNIQAREHFMGGQLRIKSPIAQVHRNPEVVSVTRLRAR